MPYMPEPETCDAGWWGCLPSDQQVQLVIAGIVAGSLLAAVLMLVLARKR